MALEGLRLWCRQFSLCTVWGDGNGNSHVYKNWSHLFFYYLINFIILHTIRVSTMKISHYLIPIGYGCYAVVVRIVLWFWFDPRKVNGGIRF